MEILSSVTFRSGCGSSRGKDYGFQRNRCLSLIFSSAWRRSQEAACMDLTILLFAPLITTRYFTNMVTYSLFLDDFDDDDNITVLNEHDDDSILSSESSFNATDADGDTVMQDVQENLKTPSISDVGNVLTMRPCSSVDFFMSPGSSVEDDESDADSATSLFRMAFADEDELDEDSL